MGWRSTYGEVYLIQSERLKLVKIGYSKSAKTRHRNMQTNSPDRLHLRGVMWSNDAPRLEALLHAKFRRARMHREWFKPTAMLSRLLDAFSAPPGASSHRAYVEFEGKHPRVRFSTSANETPEEAAQRMCDLCRCMGYRIPRE